MSANDWKAIISEVVQGLLGLGALGGIILFQYNHQPVPELLWLLLGAILLAFGIKIGLPLQSGEATTALASTLETTRPAPVPAPPAQNVEAAG